MLLCLARKRKSTRAGSYEPALFILTFQVLIEDITQTKLDRISRTDTYIITEGLGDDISIGRGQAELGNHRTTRYQRILVGRDQDRTGVNRFEFTPIGIDDISKVEDIHSKLNSISVFSPLS